MSISAEEYEFLAKILAESSGLELGKDREYLLESRLRPVLDTLKIKDISELVTYVKRNHDPKVMRSIIDLMTTNESLFFRDGTPFSLLRDEILPELFAARAQTRTLRIWSAACSIGQEPYSIAMTLLDPHFDLTGWNIEIIASDICGGVLERARAGIYSGFEAQRGLTPRLLDRYFTRHAQGWQLKDEVKRLVRFQELNLIHPFPPIGPFDIVFCRNVLIYFSSEDKARVHERIAGIMAPDAYLFLGGAETLLGQSDSFEKWRGDTAAIYRKARKATVTPNS